MAAASDEARSIREEVGFFQAIRAALIKSAPGDGKKSTAERELAIRNLDRESNLLRNVRAALRRIESAQQIGPRPDAVQIAQ